MKTLNETDLAHVSGGKPMVGTSLAYDVAYGLAGIASTIWSAFNSPLPEAWHSGMVGGFRI